MYSTQFKFKGAAFESLLNHYWHLSREIKRKQPKLEKHSSPSPARFLHTPNV